MIKIFEGGGGIFGGDGDKDEEIEIVIEEPPEQEDLEDLEAEKRAKARRQEAELARRRVGRQRSLLAGAGSTADAPTRKAKLLGHTSA